MDLKRRIQALCKEKNVTSQQLEVDLGFGKGYISKLNTSTPNASKIQQIADYLEVPLDFLLGRPPFDHWELINQNRRDFLRYVTEDPELLDLIWGIDYAHPEQTPAKDFISMLAQCVESAYPNEDGGWSVVMRPSKRVKEKTPTLEGRREVELSPAFFRLKQGLEPYDLSESDADFLVEVYKAHIKKNQ